MSDVQHFTSIDDLGAAAASAMEGAITGLLRARERVLIAVPGGSASVIVLPRLLQRPIDWARITFTLTDERWVPPTHPDSNERLVKSLIEGAIPAPAFQRLLDFDAKPEPTRSAPVVLPEVAMLGMGTDGHVASLFPGQDVDADNFLVVTKRPDHWRVSLTPAVLAGAVFSCVVITGADKAATLALALEPGNPSELPIRHAINSGARIFVGP
jgi:6-phosphogluconolactonase